MTTLHRSIHHIPDKRSKWLFILPSLVLIGLLGLPVVALIFRSLGNGLWKHLLTPAATSALKLSLVTSVLCVGISLLTGTPLAYTLARWKFKGKNWLELLIDLPVVLPPSVAGLALLMAFGRKGIFGAWFQILGFSLPFTTTAVILAQTFVAAPLYVRAARLGFTNVDEQLEEAAHVEGANQWQLFRFVMLPLSRRAMLNGVILTWARALGEFGATILFAGNLEGVTQTMPLAIYLGLERDLGVALGLAVVLVSLSIVLLGMTRWLERD